MADPICRWRNPYINTIVELVKVLPHKEMPSYEFRTLVEERWPGFLHTPYQLACQVGLYYESEDGIYYPRFDHDIDENEASSYMKKWITRYYVPNPYTKSMKTLQQPLPFLASIIGYVFEHPDETELHSILEAVFQEKIGNIDIISNVLNTYTDLIKVDTNGNVELSAKAIEFMKQYIDRNDKKAFFEYFSESKITVDEATSKNLIFFGAPGTGKSFTIKEQTEGEDVIRTTFHPDSDYSTFVGSYKPTTREVPMRDVTGKVIVENGAPVTENRIIYEFVSQAFLQAYVGAWQKYAQANGGKPQKQYLVIEEINRGNCAQIFGDLFQLLDRSTQGFSEYPIKADADLKKHLKKLLNGLTIENPEAINALYKGEDVVGKVLNGEELLLPNNLYIWATMNTSDQSLFPIDSAFKRRWDWQYVPIANAGKGWKIQVYGKDYDWWDFLEKVNALIGDTTNSEDKKLGYFFCKPTDCIITAETFVSKVIFYLWNDVFKDFEFDGDAFIDEDNQTKLTFDKFYRADVTGKPAVRENKVDLFLRNLGVAFSDEDEENIDFENNQDIDDGGLENEGVNTNPAGGRDHSRYSINGQGSFNKRRLALECVKIYSSNHSELTAKEIVDVFLGLNLMLSGFIELRDEHLARAANVNDPQFERRYYELTLPNDEIIFINNQFTVERINDFIEKVNAQNWGIHIEKL